MASQIAGNSTVVHSLVRLTTKKTNTKVPHYYTWWTPWMCFRQVLISKTVCPNWQIWCRYSDVIMSAMVSQITSVSIVCSTACLGKENIKAPRYWPLWGESTGDRWIPLTKGSNAENISIWWHHHDNLWWVFDDVFSLLVKSHHIISRHKPYHKMRCVRCHENSFGKWNTPRFSVSVSVSMSVSVWDWRGRSRLNILDIGCEHQLNAYDD